MIRIGRKRDLSEISKMDPVITERISTILDVLDNAYGDNRNVDRSLGGFVAIIEARKDKTYLHNKYHLDSPEYCDKTSNYTETMYLAGDDYAIVMIEPKAA